MTKQLFSSAPPVVPLRAVHLDLKGCAPTFTRLIELVKLFRKLNFQIVLVEWEDMFPWKCDERLRSANAYTKLQIAEFRDCCDELELEIIPLVQGLGHAENVLRLEGNEGLREIPNRTDVFHPLNPESPQLLRHMVEDVLELLPQVKHFHLGADEVYTLGQNPASRAYLDTHGVAALYLKQFDPTFQLLESQKIRPMLWHDEVSNWSPDQISQMSTRTDLVVWGYTGDPRNSSTYHFRLPEIEKLSKIGCTLWGATAYKGADGPSANTTDLHDRQKATLGWAELAHPFDLKGVFVTGWSRYASGRIQVTPIDGALDSLANSAAILYNGALPKGGQADCLEWLDSAGEGEGFRDIFKTLKAIDSISEKVWTWLRELEEQVVNLEIEPQRANSGIEVIIFELMDAEICKARQLGIHLEKILAGRIIDPLPKFFRQSRIDPMVSCCERLRKQLKVETIAQSVGCHH